ncbi:hypothetical protein Tco_1320977 [Tanacetum coccineum]
MNMHIYIFDHVYISELRSSGRFRGQRPVVEENTIDEAINVHEEDSDDDFVPIIYPGKQATGSNGGMRSNRCRGKRPVVEENTIDEAIDVHEEDSDDDFEPASGSNEFERTKGKKRAYTDNKMNRNKKKKGEMANVAMRDTCADTEAGPSKAMEIKLKNGSLMVTKEVISEMLGLKNEGENILMNEVSDNVEMIKEWKDQFDVLEKDITPSIIKSKIRRSNVVDFNFKLNIIMLFSNIMGCCKKTWECDYSGHKKASEIFTAGLKYMRHMETYMGNTREKYECGLDVEGRKLTT